MNRARTYWQAWVVRPLSADPRRKILAWAIGLGLLCGLIDFGEPIENVVRTVRNSVASRPASGQIVVVGVDDKSVQQVGHRWPWPRRYHAKLIDRLREMGAKSIYLDLIVSERSDPANDAAFVAALHRARGRAVLPTLYSQDLITQRRIDVVPVSDFARHAELANINVWRNSFGEVWTLPFAMRIKGQLYPSFSSRLAGSSVRREAYFPIDHSVRVRSIPTISYIDVLNGTVPRSAIAGKDILVGTTSERLGDLHTIPGIGPASGVYLHALGGETLRKGVPAELGWAPFFLLLMALGIAHLYSNRVVSATALVIGVAAMSGLPFFLEGRLIFASYFPGSVTFAILVSAYAWVRIKSRSATTDPVSGLPNLTALRQARIDPDVALVIARIQNFAEIISSLPQDSERALVEQIAQRFALGLGGAALHQGDEGIFAWLAEGRSNGALGDQLEGLHAVLSAPVSVVGRSIDLAVAFGVDRSGERSINNRIGSALVVADECSAEGLKWKVHDPARLLDAEWKLSMLGRLEEALDTDELWVAYQPKLDIKTRQLIGAEALVRWTHPEKGDIPPADFIVAAESNNRIERLTLFVLDQAIAVGASINSHGIDFEMAVNLSVRLLEWPQLDATVGGLLAKHGLAPDRLTLEVTESAALNNNPKSMAMIHRLRGMGVGLSLDDYGTGFSTLEYLKDIPAHELKIDKRFVSSIEHDIGDRLMVNSTIQLAHSLGRKVVAEGVEREETLRMLAAMNCDTAQGFLISRPVRWLRLSRLILADQRKRAA